MTSRAASITATVRLRAQGVDSAWTGRFRRFEGADPTTRTMGVVIEVDAPQRREEGRRGPPLAPGLHVEVELRGQPRSGCLAVPRAAIHRERLLVVGEDNRLEARAVEIGLVQEDFVCVTSGLTSGERVVLTELAPAVEGTLLAPRPDEVAARWLAAVVRGESPAP